MSKRPHFCTKKRGKSGVQTRHIHPIHTPCIPHWRAVPALLESAKSTGKATLHPAMVFTGSPRAAYDHSESPPRAAQGQPQCAPSARPLCVGYRRRYAVHRTGLDTPTGAPEIAYWRHSTETSGTRHKARSVGSRFGTFSTIAS